MLSRKYFILPGALILTQLITPAALAVDSVSLELGVAEHAHIARIGLQSQWHSRWWQSSQYHLGGYWDMSLAQWRASRFRDAVGATQNIRDVGLTPVLRFQANDKRGWYIEAGIGAHLLSDLYDNAGQRFSTRFQFGDHLGIGYVTQNQLTFSLSVQHFSNGGIKHPNPGELFAVVKVAYPF